MRSQTRSSSPRAGEESRLALGDLVVSEEAAVPLRGLKLLANGLEHRRSLFSITAVFGLAGLLVAFLLPPQFTAETQLMPPQQNKSAVSAALGQLGDLGALVGRDSAQGGSAIFVSLLQSGTVADRLIARFDLMRVYRTKLGSRCRQALKARTEISTSKQGVITIRVSDRDGARAAALANAYVEELFHLNQTLAIGEAAQRRRFFETQLEGARARLQAAEDALNDTEKATGIIQLEAQGRVYTAAAARLRGLIAGAEAQLTAMQSSATPDNAEVQKLQSVIRGLDAKLKGLEKSHPPANSQITASEMADTSLEYLRKFREVKYHEAVFEALAKQLEAAKIDEARSAALIQVIDRAQAPDHKSSPDRALITITGMALGFMAGSAWIAARQTMARWQADERTSVYLDQLRRTLPRFFHRR